VFRLGVFKKHWGGVKGGQSPAKRTLDPAPVLLTLRRQAECGNIAAFGLTSKCAFRHLSRLE
ncbi:hypothetical protein, partial [Accumulibacter sp.]|uniref:hypothetical protein n=1 Tax=Accumulibacter sp. TaxID=2053492 RepID=UPI002C50B5A3